MMTVRPRVRLLLVAVMAVAAIGLLAASGLDDSLVYYRSPSEVTTLSADAGRLRLGGLVQIGSVARRGQDVHFVLTDGVSQVSVVHRGDPPGVFQEGQGALVEGSLDDTGVFRSDLLIVKHSNEYSAPDGEDDTPPPYSAGARR
ncbi:cytochrome c maturation protein CcmE [Euzebya sp.]|uniref:cytochrome c maturation protein CcmE n=1 Tax=Euzebya sp. TaxID=1971409 RepID=UPI003512F5AD